VRPEFVKNTFRTILRSSPESNENGADWPLLQPSRVPERLPDQQISERKPHSSQLILSVNFPYRNARAAVTGWTGTAVISS
jgi:hypothetical protein